MKILYTIGALVAVAIIALGVATLGGDTSVSEIFIQSETAQQDEYVNNTGDTVGGLPKKQEEKPYNKSIGQNTTAVSEDVALNWKVFEDSEGFVFEYPSSFVVEQTKAYASNNDLFVFKNTTNGEVMKISEHRVASGDYSAVTRLVKSKEVPRIGAVDMYETYIKGNPDMIVSVNISWGSKNALDKKLEKSGTIAITSYLGTKNAFFSDKEELYTIANRVFDTLEW